jgi:hypothetical protein
MTHIATALPILAAVTTALPELPLYQRLLVAGVLYLDQHSRNSAGSFT